MSKFAKITLLTLAASLLLGFSVTANAAKPFKTQVIASAPLHAAAYKCTALNFSDRAIRVTIKVFNAQGAQIGTTTDPMINPRATWYVTSPSGTGEAKYCTVSWDGEINEVRASFCTWEDTVADGDQGLGNCLELW